MTDRDALDDRLAALDPARADHAPDRGSARHAHILARAGLGQRRRRTPVFVAGAAAAVLAVLAAVVLVEPDRALSPAAALTQAVENTGEALTLRSEYVRDDGNGGFSVVRAEHRGGDVRRSFSVIEADGTERSIAEDDDFVVYIGDRGWTAGAGPDEAVTVRPEERNAPYAESSAAIVEAAVIEATVEEVGAEEVRDTEATHYRIRLDDGVIRRLGELPANQLSGFELESPSQLRSLDVWVAGGYIRRIRVTQIWEAPDSPGATVEFYDFGADITITPPS